MITTLNEVQNLLGKDPNKYFQECESPSLRLEKFVRIGDNLKGEEINQVVANLKGEEINQVVACEAAYASAIPPFCPKGAEQFGAKLESRLIVNQAGGVLENAGMCLHPHFGSPYIPGSAVKGVARHAAWCVWNEEEDPGKKAAVAKSIARVFGFPTGDKDKDGLDVFLTKRGETTHSGCIAFLAAVPDADGKVKAKLVTDIVNCHHKAYYSGAKPKASDNEQPVPLYFPAVESGSSFLFTLVPLRTAGREEMDAAKAWLLKAITENGVGAKTAAGYGWFSFSEEAEAKRKKEQIESEEKKQEKVKIDGLVLTIQALAKKDSNTPEFAAELDAIMKNPVFGEKIPVAAQEEFRRQQRRMPVKSAAEKLRDEWEHSPNIKAIVNGDIKRFASLPDEKKANIVQLLREPQGRGHEVWVAIKAEPKGDIAKAAMAIRVYSKETLKQGKMP